MEDYIPIASAVVMGIVAILKYFDKRKMAGHIQDIYLNYKAITKAETKDHKAQAVETLFDTLVDKTGVKKKLDKALKKGKTRLLNKFLK